MESKKKILVVDDDPGFREACRVTFEAKLYDTVLSPSREDALERMKEDPDLVILGTLEPAGEAFRLHQWLKAQRRYADVPLMVIDAAARERGTKGWRKFEGMRMQCDEYLTKPVEPSMLVPCIQHMLEEATRKIKVLIVDDHTMVRDGIAAVLALQKDVEVVGEAVDGRDAVEKAARLLPNVAIMDIAMPVMSGIEATKQIAKDYPQVKVLILTQYDEQENMLVAGRAGARGFIPKKAAGAELIQGLKAVNRGSYFPETFAEVALN
ncbi:MAG: response regulator [Thermoleophilia bacterium]|nr:response regulator [Thermoleophilia bacterium]